MCPCRATASAIADSAAAGSVTSSATGWIRPGYFSASSASAAGRRTAATTVSPASAAASVIAQPKPLLAPVTNQT